MKKEWIGTTIGEQCEVIAGQSPEGRFYNVSGIGLPFYQGKKEFNAKFIGPPTKWTSHTTKEALRGDILMSVRAPVGPINFSMQKICIGRGLAAIRVGAKVNKEFLFYALSSKQDEICGSEGAVFASINKRQIEDIKLHLPPLPEQKRIVAILDEAFAGIGQAIANTEKNLANARELFESYLNEVFTRKGEGWDDVILSNICDVRDGTHDSPKYIESGIPFITQKNIRVEGLSFEKTRFISDLDHSKFYKRSNVSKGDILISMIGANRGMSCLVNDDRIFSIKNVGLIKATDNIETLFLLYYLKSNLAKAYIEAESRGGAQPFIGLTKLRSFPVSLAPTNVQKSIISMLDASHLKTTHLEAIYQQKLKALSELKQSILQKAFTGDLTQDLPL